MFPCYSLHSSHPLHFLLQPHVYKSILYVYASTDTPHTGLSVLSFQILYICISMYFFSFGLTSLCIIGSMFIHLIKHFPFYGQVIFHCICIPQLCICLSANGHLSCFHILIIVNSATMNTGVHVSFSVLVFSGYMPINGIVGSYDTFIPSFLFC